MHGNRLLRKGEKKYHYMGRMALGWDSYRKWKECRKGKINTFVHERREFSCSEQSVRIHDEIRVKYIFNQDGRWEKTKDKME